MDLVQEACLVPAVEGAPWVEQEGVHLTGVLDLQDLMAITTLEGTLRCREMAAVLLASGGQQRAEPITRKGITEVIQL